VGDPRRRIGDHSVLEHPCPEPRSDELQHLAIADPSGHLGHQGLVIQTAERIRYVGFEHPVGAPVALHELAVPRVVDAKNSGDRVLGGPGGQQFRDR
jgi:hypothetical protein